jgi:hypothetical protein
MRNQLRWIITCASFKLMGFHARNAKEIYLRHKGAVSNADHLKQLR